PAVVGKAARACRAHRAGIAAVVIGHAATDAGIDTAAIAFAAGLGATTVPRTRTRTAVVRKAARACRARRAGTSAAVGGGHAPTDAGIDTAAIAFAAGLGVTTVRLTRTRSAVVWKATRARRAGRVRIAAVVSGHAAWVAGADARAGLDVPRHGEQQAASAQRCCQQCAAVPAFRATPRPTPKCNGKAHTAIRTDARNVSSM